MDPIAVGHGQFVQGIGQAKGDHLFARLGMDLEIMVVGLDSQQGGIAAFGGQALSERRLGLGQGRWSVHRRWMIRSWSLTLAAVTLRIYLPVVIITGLPFAFSYQVVAFLAWVPNLLLAEWLLRRRP